MHGINKQWDTKFILPPLINKDHILEVLSKPIPGLGMNGNYVFWIDLLDGPSDVKLVERLEKKKVV